MHRHDAGVRAAWPATRAGLFDASFIVERQVKGFSQVAANGRGGSVHSAGVDALPLGRAPSCMQASISALSMFF